MNMISIRVKLPAIMVMLTLLAVVTMGVKSFAAARATVFEDSRARLAAIGQAQARSVEELFLAISRDLALVAEHPYTRAALAGFTTAFEGLEDAERDLQRAYIDENPHPMGAKDRLLSAGSGSVYDAVHERYHPPFDRIQDANGYYDVFLFDTDGNLVYSVFKERDFATNMRTGEWRDTGLARVFGGAVERAAEDPPVFEDFAPYGPSADAPASFIARPVFDVGGTLLGVLAFQMPVDAINEAAQSVSGLGETGAAYLVGPDGLLRTDSLHTAENDILSTPSDGPAVAAALGGAAAVDVDGASGVERLYAALPLSVVGTPWAVVVQQDMAEVNKPLTALAWAFLRNGALIVGAALLLAVLTARGVSGPLTTLGDAMQAISGRRYDTEVPATGRGDEIGAMARTLEAFRTSLAAAEGVAREAAFKGAGFEVAGAPMMMTDTELTIVYANTAMSRLIANRSDDLRKSAPRFDGATLLGKSLDIFPFPNGAMRDRVASGEALPIREKIRIGDAFLGLLFDAVKDRDGTHIGYVVEWRDQTVQMGSEVVLKALDATQCRVEMSLDGRIKLANALFGHMLGADPADLAGAAGKDILSAVDAASGSADLWEAVAAGEARFGVFRARRGGTERLVEGSLSPIPDERGRTTGFLLMGVDVTDRQAEMARGEAHRSAMEANQSRIVTALAEALGRLADGDVTTRIAAGVPEDYEALRHDFNAAMEALDAALVTVVTNAGAIRSEAAEISSATGDLSRRTAEQAASLEETAAAIEQLTVSIRSAAKSAGEAAGIAAKARSNAEAGGQVVDRAVAAMSALDRSSQEIARIVEVIDGIAFQTNLLALNAGVEAARAGDAGRGFAVVAAEVRALAQRCSEAASEIGTLIGSATDQVKSGVTLVGETGTALKDIIRSVNDIASHVSAIAASAEEQSTGLSEINAAMGQLDRSTQQNAAMVEETTAASQLLDTEARALADLTARFRVGTAPTRAGSARATAA
jgi:methyl-accepting chemotaxis protein